MAKDEYANFENLSQHQVPNIDFRIRLQNIGSKVTIIAPHGGKIEPGTSYITQKIAGQDYNWYCFEGIKANHNRILHITSHCFDEPRAIKLLSLSDIVVAIHACKGSHEIVYLGGLDTDLRDVIACELKKKGIPVQTESGRMGGVHPNNICNRGVLQKGVQLEISRGLRDHIQKMERICKAVRKALKQQTG